MVPPAGALQTGCRRAARGGMCLANPERMGFTASSRWGDESASLARSPGVDTRLAIVLVQEASKPLYRNERVDGNILRCGLGRMLEGMDRYDPGVDVEVLIVINEATATSQTRAPEAHPGRRLLGPLRRWAERRRCRRSERRRDMYRQ